MHPRIEETLTQKTVPYRTHRHDALNTPIRSPHDFAAAIGYDIKRITKTLFVRSTNHGQYALVVCPMDRKVDFGTVARFLGCSRIEVAAPAELREKLGYPPNGVSPLAADGIPVLIEQDLLHWPTILIGAGRAGVEIELSPTDLQALTAGSVLRLAS